MRWHHLVLVAAVSALGACDWMDGASKRPLPGERTAVLSTDRKIEPDERLRGLDVRLPEAIDLAQ